MTIRKRKVQNIQWLKEDQLSCTGERNNLWYSSHLVTGKKSHRGGFTSTSRSEEGRGADREQAPARTKKVRNLTKKKRENRPEGFESDQ